MTTKRPTPQYDESIVQRIDPAPAEPRDQHDPHRWSGGFFRPGRRVSDPGESDGDPFNLGSVTK
ncbi:MAG: hypothetical protein IT556_07920 [Acetobacteraceae bacterium]|nr:hypothetical protein [Acetobacteraceae bacterium]